jgi:hypothetical protein
MCFSSFSHIGRLIVFSAIVHDLLLQYRDGACTKVNLHGGDTQNHCKSRTLQFGGAKTSQAPVRINHVRYE